MSIHLSKIIYEELENNSSPDPREVARAVVDRLPEEYKAEILASFLTHEVRIRIGQERANFKKIAASSRWSELGKATNAESWRVPVGDSWKFFLDLTADDCAAVAARYEAQASELLVYAKHFQRLGDALRQAGVETVRELPPDLQDVA